ncbi:MAG TPA: Bax inhibitor-1/YccA family protein [Flavobacteriales bacterium]|nr:Bax inhibitor-1/YccA family protein [Flavobacteriales bacterium]
MSNSILDAFGQKTYDESKPMARTFIANVFAYMFAGLAISGVIAFAMSRNPIMVLELFYTLKSNGTLGISPVGYIMIFAPLIISLVMQLAYHKLPFAVILGLFLIYAVLIGMSLSTIFLAYTASSIYMVFFLSAGIFGVMALAGYFTSIDLSRFGTIMMFMAMGIVAASLMNVFMQSEKMDWMISLIGVIVFPALVAVKLQEIKYMSQNTEYGSEPASKLAVIMGLQLYILFINIFIMLLRLMGDRR